MNIILVLTVLLVTLTSIMCIEDQMKSTIQCPPNEMPTTCFNECGRNCNDRSRIACTVSCISGDSCTCKRGFWRDTVTGRCVRMSDCSPDQSLDLLPVPIMTCGANEEYIPCGTCDKTCENPMRICSQACIPKCNCLNGYVRNSNNKCINQRLCQ